MINHEMSLNPVAFADMESGNKTVEVRINDPKRQSIKIGDTITYKELPTKIRLLLTKVVGKSEFANFDDLYRGIDPVRVGYKSEESPEECAAGTRQYYTPEDEQKYGVVGIHIKLIC